MMHVNNMTLCTCTCTCMFVLHSLVHTLLATYVPSLASQCELVICQRAFGLSKHI